MNIQLFRQRSANDKSSEPASVCVADVIEATSASINGFEREVILDLAEVTQLSSDELRAIMHLHLLLSDQERQLVFVNVRGQVAETIALTRLNRSVEVRNPAELV